MEWNGRELVAVFFFTYMFLESCHISLLTYFKVPTLSVYLVSYVCLPKVCTGGPFRHWMTLKWPEVRGCFLTVMKKLYLGNMRYIILIYCILIYIRILRFFVFVCLFTWKSLSQVKMSPNSGLLNDILRQKLASTRCFGRQCICPSYRGWH